MELFHIRDNDSHMNKKHLKIYIIACVFMFVLGAASPFLSSPYNNLSFMVVTSGVLLLTYVYFKTSKRQHKDGIFSQWTDPNQFISMKLNYDEKLYFILGIIMMLSPMISFAIVVIVNKN
jgi:hypothetical protein